MGHLSGTEGEQLPKIGCVGHDCAECQRRLRRGSRSKEFMVVFEPFVGYRNSFNTAVLVVEAASKRAAIKKAIDQAAGAYQERHFKKPHAEPLVRGLFYRL